MRRLRGAFDIERYDPDTSLPDIDTDIPRACQGLVGGQFWAAYVRGGEFEVRVNRSLRP